MGDSRAWDRFVKSRPALAGAGILATVVLFSLLVPLASRHGPLESDFVRGVSAAETPVGPNADFPFGADRLFRDVLARLAAGARISLLIAVGATAIATFLGACVGIVSGWNEGLRTRVPWPVVAGALGTLVGLAMGRPGVAAVAVTATVATAGVKGLLGRQAPAGSGAAQGSGPQIDIDGWLMRLVDVALAFPFLLLVMAIGAAFDRVTPVTVFVTLGVTGWVGPARVLRAKTMQVRSLEYIEASRALGQSTPRLLWDHVLPNVSGTLIVLATVQVAQMIVADSVLSYLGVGISPPAPTWGRMLLEGQDQLSTAPWLVVAPGAAILLTVWAFNTLGEGLRDALDPTEV
jgi:ABC-type dipeptide/oligopeptide/nickel transport system permease subunit